MRAVAHLTAAVAAVAAVAVASAPAAVDPSRLALMPLPKKALGPDAAPLQRARDSGLDTNADAARHAGAGVTAAELARDGRITGYTLHYAARVGTPTTATSLLDVQSIAELYRTPAAAAEGLVFWRRVTRAGAGPGQNGVTVRLAPFTADVGAGAFAFVLTYERGGRPLLRIGDVVFRKGALLGAVFVAAPTEAGLRARTVLLARRLERRMQLVLGGRSVR